MDIVSNFIKEITLTTKLVVGAFIALIITVLFLIHELSAANASTSLADPGSLIVRQIRDVSELTTATFEMDAVVPVSDKGVIAESKLLYIAHGNVRVGIDLSQLQSNDVQVDGEKITVTLPPLKILGSTLDLEHSSVYSYSRGFLGSGPDVVNLQTQAQREALRKVEEASCRNWLMKTAGERVQKTVEHLLSQVLKGKEIIVKAQLPDEGSCSSRTSSSTNVLD
ncbi:MAG: DUF4230 domain-containing protein [Oscillatoriales cyanobacterium]|nr:MAG: DUF4230 domain-containing protein [Oscillatoriales cyanobacterium]